MELIFFKKIAAFQILLQYCTTYNQSNPRVPPAPPRHTLGIDLMLAPYGGKFDAKLHLLGWAFGHRRNVSQRC